MLKNIGRCLKKLNNDLKKLNKYQDNITHGLDYLFNEDDYYKPTEVKSAFDGNYILYESRGDKDAELALYEYFDKIKPHLKDMIDYYKSKGEWKIQITMIIIFIFFIDKNETQVMHTKSDSVEIMNGTDTSDAINKLINSFMKRYQEGLETKMKGSSYIFERIDLLEYHLHKISLNRGSSYTDSPIWIKNKGVTIKTKNKDKCFQYAITAALNYQNIGSHLERISKLKPFINNYNWKDTEFPSHSKDWRKFESNNKAIALNILYVPYNTKEIRQAYISIHNDERNNQVNLLMITDGTNNWHYLAIKNISGLLRGITSNHNGDFDCLNCLHSYRPKNKLKKHEKICKDHDFCSYTDSPIWIKNKGVTIKTKNKDKCFQYAITAALNYQNIGSHLERISKLKPFINNYNWKDTEFPSHSKDWRKFESNNKAIALNILYVPYNTKEIRQAYISIHNDEHNNQVNLLMITDGTNNWHYLAIKNISGLLRGITSNHNGDFDCLNCLHSYRPKNKLKKHEKLCKNHDFCMLIIF